MTDPTPTPAPEAQTPGGMVPTEYGMVPGCPNTPPCSHARIAHDVEDFDDPLPMCCVDGCRCGHDRSQLPGPTPTPDTAAPLPYTDKLKAAVYEATAVLPPKVGEFMSEYFRRCAYWAGQGIEDGDLRDEPLADEVLALAARSVAGTPTPIWYGPDLVREAGLEHVDDETRQRVHGAFDSAGAGTAALTEDPAAEFLHWLIRLDDPADARGVEDRRTVTLNQIIERARRVLAGDGRE